MNVKQFKQIIEKAVKKAVKEELSSFLNENVHNKPHKSSDTLKKTFTQTHTNPTIASILNETYESGDWKSLNDGFTSNDALGFTGALNNPAGALIPNVDIDNRPVDVSKLPDGVISAFKKDYSNILKKSKEISLKKG
jgi:hypothetical protein